MGSTFLETSFGKLQVSSWYQQAWNPIQLNRFKNEFPAIINSQTFHPIQFSRHCIHQRWFDFELIIAAVAVCRTCSMNICLRVDGTLLICVSWLTGISRCDRAGHSLCINYQRRERESEWVSEKKMVVVFRRCQHRRRRQQGKRKCEGKKGRDRCKKDSEMYEHQ